MTAAKSNAADAAAAEAAPSDETLVEDVSPLEKKIVELAKVAVPLATIAAAGIAGAIQGPGMAILVLAGGALVGVIAAFWASVRTLVGETPLSGADAYAIGAPRAEEEQKRAVLRALKDLEFERSVGKISEDDYRALVAQYRAEAKRLLRFLDADAQPRRKHVEALVAKRLRRVGLTDRGVGLDSEAATADGETVDIVAKPVTGKKRKAARISDATAAPSGRACAACQTMNDHDALFCKKCGTRTEPAEQASSAADSAPQTDEEESA